MAHASHMDHEDLQFGEQASDFGNPEGVGVLEGIGADYRIVSNGQEHAYRELLFTDTQLELDGMGGLQEVLVDQDTGQLDINGLPIIIQVPVNVGPSMSSNGARVSYFFEKIVDLFHYNNSNCMFFFV